MLVAYFSRTGYTQRLAEEMAKAAGADIDRIVERRSRSGLFGYFRSAREALRGASVEIVPATLPPGDHGLVVLGTPVWASHVCSPVRSYIAAHAQNIAQVAFFCTQGGSGAAKVFQEMEELCGRAPIATLAVADRELDRGTYAPALADFLAALRPKNAA